MTMTGLENTMQDEDRLEQELFQMQADDFEEEAAVRREVALLEEMVERYSAMAQLARSQGQTGPELDWVVQQHEQLRDTLELLARYGGKAL
jgi:hypothetical protein